MRWDLIIPVIVMYVAVAIVTGVALKRVKNSSDYMLGGRNLGYGLVIPHIIGAFFGAGSTIGVTSLAFIWGFGGAWYNMAEAVGLWVLMVFLARRLWHLGRRLDFVTLPDLLESYYGKKFKAITGLFIGLGYMSWVAGQIVGGGRILEMITGFPLLYSIIISALLVGFYAGFGGLFGSVYADLIFGSMTVIGSIFVAPILVHQLGGWSYLLSLLPENYDSFFWLGETKPIVGIYGLTSLKWFMWYLIVFVPAFAIGQLNIQRIYACKSEKVAHGMSTFIASYVFVQPVFFAIIGMVAFALNPSLPARDAAAPWVMSNVMGTILGAIFLCSVMATIMSCAAGGLNTAVASFVRDIWKMFKPDINEMKAGRVASLIIMVLSLVFALALPDVVGWLALGFTLMSIGLFMPTVVLVAKKGKVTKWANATGAVWSSLIGGFVTIVWQVLSETYGQPFSSLSPAFIGLPTAFILLFVVSRIAAERHTSVPEEYKERLEVINEVFEQIKPTWAKEGKGTLIFIASAIFAILILPKLLYLL